MKFADLARNPLARMVAAIVVAALCATLAWRYTPLREFVTPERIVGWVETFAQFWWAPYAVALLYTPASFVLFPRALLTMAATIAFGAWEGFAVALGGIALNALVGYAIGRSLDEAAMKRWGGKRVDRIAQMLRREGFMAVTTIGLLPVAPFIISVIAFGALRLRIHHVIAGVLLAHLPGTIGSTLLGDQVAAALSQHRSINLWIVAAVIAGMALLAWTTRRWWKKLQAAAT
ncbi:MAG TPA: VTT domain-containing protein [Usitatibacter sp.]|nr:VTT domain-containing protein [Usitatibacter sp.]